jgi:hypothetical protein
MVKKKPTLWLIDSPPPPKSKIASNEQKLHKHVNWNEDKNWKENS